MLPQNPDTNYAQGDLYKKPVVINMSLVVPPSDEEAKKLKFKPQFTHQLRSHLLKPMHRMSELGAIFVASAGNEADPREGSKAMNPSGMRPFALYPAAFAYNVAPDPVPAVIPVGAVNGQREASSYSSYPGPKGIGTYGGEVPDPIPANPPAMPPTPGCYTQAINIDALIGIYCSESYPALSLDDCQSTYPAPNLNAWSYWVGTSFASPIITALVARYVEWKGFSLPPDANVTQDIISKLTTDEVLWTHLEPNDGSIAGPMVYAVQCPPEQSGETDMVVEEIDVEVVEVVIEENQ
jgi:hypothetical protein